jgi:hypothetical protein
VLRCFGVGKRYRRPIVLKLVSIQKWPFSAISASTCGIVCAAYDLYASAQSLDFLDFAKNCSFLNWKLELMPIVGDFHFRMGSKLGVK